MKATEFIKHQLESSRGWAMGLIGDMKDAPLTQPTDNGGNHPLWVLGHLTRAESDLFDCFIQGKPNRFPELESCAMGSTPSTNADDYPPMDEIFEKFETIRGEVLAYLETLSDDDLDKPSHAPEEFGPFFATVGACFAAMGTHVAFHAGQVADARRMLGKQPLMA